MSWTWRLETSDGTTPNTAEAPANPTHGNQSDAETWLGETWRELSEAGIATATLFEDDRLVYGPMSLSEA